MTDFLDESELRVLLKLDGPSKLRTWTRVKPYFAPALFSIPTEYGKGHRLYITAKVRELLAARQSSQSPLSRVRTLRSA